MEYTKAKGTEEGEEMPRAPLEKDKMIKFELELLLGACHVVVVRAAKPNYFSALIASTIAQQPCSK